MLAEEVGYCCVLAEKVGYCCVLAGEVGFCCVSAEEAIYPDLWVVKSPQARICHKGCVCEAMGGIEDARWTLSMW